MTFVAFFETAAAVLSVAGLLWVALVIADLARDFLFWLDLRFLLRTPKPNRRTTRLSRKTIRRLVETGAIRRAP